MGKAQPSPPNGPPASMFLDGLTDPRNQCRSYVPASRHTHSPGRDPDPPVAEDEAGCGGSPFSEYFAEYCFEKASRSITRLECRSSCWLNATPHESEIGHEAAQRQEAF